MFMALYMAMCVASIGFTPLKQRNRGGDNAPYMASFAHKTLAERILQFPQYYKFSNNICCHFHYRIW